MPRQTIADAAHELLDERRAATSADLADPIAAAGLTRAKSPTQAVTRALGGDRRFRRLVDGRWIAPGQLLDGMVLTHRLAPEEAAHSALALVPDLAPLMAADLLAVCTSGGTPLILVWDAAARELTGLETDAALQGPPGWLQGATAGELLHVTLVGRTLAVAPRSEPSAASRMRARRIVETVRRELDAQPDLSSIGIPPSASLQATLLGMLVDEPDLLHAPMAPLSELFADSDLEVHRGWVGHPGTDWEALDEFMDVSGGWDDEADLPAADELDDEDDEALAQRLADAFQLDEAEVQALQIALGAYELHRRGRDIEDPETLARLATISSVPAIGPILAGSVAHDAEFEPFMRAIEQAAVGPDAAGPRFVLAAHTEAHGDVLGAERLLRGARAADPAYRPATIELARYETDRGRFGEALLLLREADIPADDPERAWLEDAGRSAFPKVGRNDRCPCGSGRKYKACHLGREAAVASVRPADALRHKLRIWLEQPSARRRVHALIHQVVPDSARPERDDDERDAIDGPLLDDVMLFDRGEIARFLRDRGPLLPEGEERLARSWLTTRRSLYEVRSVRAGKGLTVRDVLAEAPEVRLDDRSLSVQTEKLDLLCLRLLPDGAGSVTPSDGMLIPRTHRARVADIIRSGDPIELLRWLARPNPMPQLQNMEGEPLILVETTYRVPDPAAAAMALARELTDEGDGHFVETFERGGRDMMRGSITLDGEIARIEANSVKRAKRLERILLRVAPESRLIRREERGIEEALEALTEKRAAGVGDDPGIDLTANPDVASALDAMMREHEERWVDDSIPALGGLTPRQALDDPVMRRELEALIDDMEWHSRGATSGTMDAARIRALLGIGERG